MIKVSDYVARFLVEQGVADLFLVSGGGIMHLLDSVSRQQGLNYVCNYHEQASAVAAEGYARIRGLGACLVTVGPGAVNALAGAVGAWYDSIPTLVIAGQVRRDLIADFGLLRQKGPQEANAVGMARAVTKYATTVLHPEMIRLELEHALYEARSGRPGPAFVEIPLDVQGALVDENSLEGFDSPQPPEGEDQRLRREARLVLAEIRKARRPVLVPGNGIHSAGAERALKEVLERLRIPVVLADSGKDLVPEVHPRYVGIFGTCGQRRANFAVQNSDCLVVLAAGLSVKKVGFNTGGFAPRARRVVVDIDDSQLHAQALVPDVAIRADIGDFLEALLEELGPHGHDSSPRWLAACADWRTQYPVVEASCLREGDHVGSYVFMDHLSDALQVSDVLVTGNGLDWASCIQAFRVKEGQRVITSGNWGSMGWDLPMTVGACLGTGGRRTICVAGDGSLQWNVQELLTIGQRALPVKLFVFDNLGYSSIRATQRAFFEGRLVGADRVSGVANPNFTKLAEAYGLHPSCIARNGEILEGLARVLESPDPELCVVKISPEQSISPKASAFRREDGSFESRPLEDMSPFLPRAELQANMRLFDDEDGVADGNRGS